MKEDEEERRIAAHMGHELGLALGPERRVGPLFHYTNAAGLQGILAKGQLWATHFAHLDDSSELLSGEEIVTGVAEELRDAEPPRSPKNEFLASFVRLHQSTSLTKAADIYVASLSSKGNLLSQWRARARGARYSIGFTSLLAADEARAGAAYGLELVRCEYDRARFKKLVSDALHAVADGWQAYSSRHDLRASDGRFGIGVMVALRRIAALVVRFKNPAFEEEKEWRLVAVPAAYKAGRASPVRFRPGKAGVVPYIPIDLAVGRAQIALEKVYVGPAQDPEAAVRSARLLLDAHGYDGESAVEGSGIPFRG